MSKLLRVVGAFTLAFSWLLMAGAGAVSDPLEQARLDIQQLDKDILNLVDKTKTQELLDIAHSKYDTAVALNETLSGTETALENAQEAYNIALNEKNSAQAAVDTQTSIKNSAYDDLQAKQSAYESAQIALNANIASLGYGGNQGVAFQIYPLSRYSDGTAYISHGAGLICQGALPYFYTYAGDGRICGASQNIIGIFRAKLTVPANINDVYFAAYTDDGSRIYVDGVLETEQWQEQGSTWSPYTRHFDTSIDKTLDLEVWWYNGGGPGNMTIGWGYNGIWTGIPGTYLSYGVGLTSQQQAERDALQSDRDIKYTAYNSALITFDDEVQNLTIANQNLTIKTQNLTTAEQNLTIANQNLTTAQSNYDAALLDVQNAIISTREEYNKQYDFEEKQRVAAAIAQALANQPQPSPEPTIIVDPTPEPSPEPSPEQTKPTDPTPEPSPETSPSVEPTSDPSPEPSVEPSPEPSPQQTDTPVDPEPEPTPDVPITEGKTENTPISNEMANLIADLTNTNTLTKLTPEQKAAVAGTLGIKASEIAKVAELAKSDPILAEALQEFGDRANANLDAPMPYTLADATTELQTEAFLADPLGQLFNVNPLELLSNFSELGSDMTDDQREKVQEVVIPVIIVSQIASTMIGMRR